MEHNVEEKRLMQAQCGKEEEALKRSHRPQQN
jgi:hypothetical protein